MQEHLYKHFESESHSSFRDDVSVILIDKTDGSNPTKIETYLMKILKTIACYGLSVEKFILMWGISGGKEHLAGHPHYLDFGTFLGQGIRHDLYDSYLLNLIYLVIYLLVNLGLSRFTFISRHRTSPKDAFKRL